MLHFDVHFAGDDSIKYDFSSKKIVLLNTRNKRNIGDDYDDMEKTFRIPNDVEIQKDTVSFFFMVSFGHIFPIAYCCYWGFRF